MNGIEIAEFAVDCAIEMTRDRHTHTHSTFCDDDDDDDSFLCDCMYVIHCSGFI